MIIAQNADGRLELFLKSHHKWQTAPNNGWSEWAPFQFAVSFGTTPIGELNANAIARNADGRLEFFWTSLFGSTLRRHVLHTAQTSANNGWFNKKFDLDVDESFINPTDWSSDPTVSQNADGRLEIFVLGTNGSIYHRAQISPGSAWTDTSILAGNFDGTPIVARNADGRLEVFTLGTDKAIYHISQVSPGQAWRSWEPFLGIWNDRDPIVAQWADGRLAIFALGTDNGIWTNQQSSPGGGWLEFWTPLGGVWNSPPVVTRTADGRLEVFAIGPGNILQTIWQTAPNNNSWTSWLPFGGPRVIDMAVPRTGAELDKLGQNEDGRMEIIVLGDDGFLYDRWQVAPNGDWSDWTVFSALP